MTSPLINILGSDVIQYRPSLMPIGKTVTGVLILNQMMYWWKKTVEKGLTEFYKFQSPCDNEKYKPGDSWEEELGFSKRIFVGAFKKIGVYKTTKSKLKNIEKLKQKSEFGELSKTEIKELDNYNNAIIYYRIDENHVTWYRLNDAHLAKLLFVIYDNSLNNKKSFRGVTKSNLVNRCTETTTETTNKDLLHKSMLDKNQAMDGYGISRGNKKFAIKRKLKNNGLKNKNTKKLLYNTINTKTLSYYNQLISVGGTNHKETSKAYLDTMDKIHALFSKKRKPPYYSCLVPEEFIDYKWTLKEVKEIFEFQLNNAESYNCKIVKSIGQFIISKGFNGVKNWSPLLVWHKKFNKTNENDLTEYGQKLFKSFKRAKIDCRIIENKFLNKIGKKIKSIEKRYEFYDDSASIYYPMGIVDYFTGVYMKEKLNNEKFIIQYMKKKTFIDEFVEVAVLRNVIKTNSNYLV